VGRWIGIGGGGLKREREREEGEGEVKIMKGMEIKSFSPMKPLINPPILRKKRAQARGIKNEDEGLEMGWYGMGIGMEDRDGRRRISKKTKKGSVEVGRGRERGS